MYCMGQLIWSYMSSNPDIKDFCMTPKISGFEFDIKPNILDLTHIPYPDVKQNQMSWPIFLHISIGPIFYNTHHNAPLIWPKEGKLFNT